MKLPKEPILRFLKNRIVLSVLGLLLVVALWEIIAFSTGLLFLPEFFSCLTKAFSLLGLSRTYEGIGYTLLRLFLALLGSGTVGAVLGTLAGYYKPIEPLLQPLITILRSFPTVAMVLLLIVFVPMAPVWVVSFVVFPVIYQASLEGAKKTNETYGMLIRLKGKNKVSNLTHVVFPLSFDSISLGFIQAMGLGMKVEIMAETFSYTTNEIGLGQMIMASYQAVDYQRMMALVLVALLIILVLEGLLKLGKEKIHKMVYAVGGK